MSKSMKMPRQRPAATRHREKHAHPVAWWARSDVVVPLGWQGCRCRGRDGSRDRGCGEGDADEPTGWCRGSWCDLLPELRRTYPSYLGALEARVGWSWPAPLISSRHGYRSKRGGRGGGEAAGRPRAEVRRAGLASTRWCSSSPSTTGEDDDSVEYRTYDGSGSGLSAWKAKGLLTMVSENVG